MLKNDFTFWKFYYVTTLIKKSLNNKTKSCCVNINCSLSIDEQAYINEIFSNVKVKQFVALLLIRNINNIIYSSNKYIIVDVYINSYIKKNDKQLSIINKFSIEIHIVDDFKVNLLLSNNVFKIQRAAININV